MDLRLKRKEIRQAHFPIGGLIIISFLGCAGIFLLFYSGILGTKNLDMLYECIYKNGLIIIFGLFFFFSFIYCWIKFFLNVMIEPKRDILCLHRNKNNEVSFVDRNGKKFVYDINDLKEESYYFVLKTHDCIYEILEETNDNWTPIEKESYWSNLYSPVGNYKNVLLLPIVYTILLPGVLSILMSKGTYKIYGLIFIAIPVYIIGYDLIYKIKLKKSSNGIVDDSKLIKSYQMLMEAKDIIACILEVISLALICTYIINVIFNIQDFFTTALLFPFLCISLCGIAYYVSRIFHNNKLEMLFLRVFGIIFFTSWFAFLFFLTITVIKENLGISILFTIPFWIGGVYAAYKYYKTYK